MISTIKDAIKDMTNDKDFEYQFLLGIAALQLHWATKDSLFSILMGISAVAFVIYAENRN